MQYSLHVHLRMGTRVQCIVHPFTADDDESARKGAETRLSDVRNQYWDYPDAHPPSLYKGEQRIEW